MRGLLRTSTRPTFNLLLAPPPPPPHPLPPPPPPRACVSIHPEDESCGHVRYRFECSRLFSMTLLLGHVRLPLPRWKLHSTILPFQDQDEYLLYTAGWCALGWCFRIRTDSVEGRIRADFEQPRRDFFGPFCSLYGHFDPTEMDSGFGRIRSRVGFGRIRADSWAPNMESANPGCAWPPVFI